jgi:hypothetical protein
MPFLPAGIGVSTTVTENSPLPTGWTLTDSGCNVTSVGSNPDAGSGAFFTLTFIPNFGDNIVCSYTNSNAETTRTQGFWATHTQLSDAVWGGNGTAYPATGVGTPVINPGDPSIIGSPDSYLCGVQITALPQNAENVLMGGFWSNIAQKSTKGGKRSPIDQARMQMVQQYLAAVLNSHMFGSTPPSPFSVYRSDYCGTDASKIQADIGILGNFNQSGDSLAFEPGQSATAQTSKSQADLDAWDTPVSPQD